LVRAELYYNYTHIYIKERELVCEIEWRPVYRFLLRRSDLPVLPVPASADGV
jgi:hypothetical protein